MPLDQPEAGGYDLIMVMATTADPGAAAPHGPR
jgi:hypothetical protein